MDDLKVGLLSKEKPKDKANALRYIQLNGETKPRSFPHNIVKNTKYNLFSIVPVVLYQQFKYFFNLFFLLITLSQFFPPLQVGFLFTYVAPLSFVLCITIVKEAYDDIIRWKRDQEVNNQIFTRITKEGRIDVRAKDIKVGHLIEIKANERIPADMVLIYTSEVSGTVFIRTDQLDGETDWKLRKAVAYTQNIGTKENFYKIRGSVIAEAPHKNIYGFSGVFSAELENGGEYNEPLSLESTLWASTVLTCGTAVGLIVYAGKETRSVMNSNLPSLKFGVCDSELNFLSKLLFGLMVVISIVMVLMSGITSTFYLLFFRYLLLLSSIIPISLRVNLDMAKILYCYLIPRDNDIPNTIARNSNIPEELGRIQYLLTDKTGTLTRNEMSLKKLSIIDGKYTVDDKFQMDEFKFLRGLTTLESKYKYHKSENIKRMVKALALCHNVSPVTESGETVYQASSPDEIALVRFGKDVGINLTQRGQDYIQLTLAKNTTERYSVLRIFPFSSARKRMGILLQHPSSTDVLFYLKGAEDVMKSKISQKDAVRILEECENLAREGLRTLIIAQKTLSINEYKEWEKEYKKVSLCIENREEKEREVIDKLEVNMEALGVTGVEDKLQENVADTIESLRDAGIKVWILTGDKVETAECIAISTKLKSREEDWFEMIDVPKENILAKLDEFSKTNTKILPSDRSKVLVIDGATLNSVLKDFRQQFIESACLAPSVVCCRVAPTQKSQIVDALKEFTDKRICSIGDGGNDVGMIQAAHIGIGVEGKEGKQASLAADFSIAKFNSLSRLVLWHGRLSYKRTAKLSYFVFHRGLIISFIQALFTCIFFFSAIPIYNGMLMLGYTSAYTMMPVFSLVLDVDADVNSIMRYPVLYESLQTRKLLRFTSFCVCIFKSFYQGSVIIIMTLVLFPDNNFFNIVVITFSALIATELLNIMTEIDKFHWAMGVSEVVTLVLYIASMLTMRAYFDLFYLFSLEFVWKVLIITIISWMPLHVASYLFEKFYPADHKKVQ